MRKVDKKTTTWNVVEQGWAGAVTEIPRRGTEEWRLKGWEDLGRLVHEETLGVVEVGEVEGCRQTTR